MEATESDPEAERGLLGCLLTDSAARERLLGMLDQDCFTDPLHRRLFAAMVDLCVGGWAIDPANLVQKTHLEMVEVQRFFQPAPTGPDPYLRRVVDHALRRGLAQTLTALWASGTELSFRQLLEEHAAVLQNLSTRYLPTEPSQDMHQLVPEALEAIMLARRHDRRSEQFIATGSRCALGRLAWRSGLWNSE